MSNKGQGIIGEVVLFIGSIAIAITVFLIIQTQGSSVMEQEIQTEVDEKFGQITSNNIMSITLQGKLHSYPSIARGRYSNEPAYRVISYYFSTPGNKVYFDKKREGIEKIKLKRDLKKYLEHRLDNLLSSASDVDYYLNIQNFNENLNGKPREITVNTTSFKSESDYRGTIYLSNHEKAYITFYTEGDIFFFRSK